MVKILHKKRKIRSDKGKPHPSASTETKRKQSKTRKRLISEGKLQKRGRKLECI